MCEHVPMLKLIMRHDLPTQPVTIEFIAALYNGRPLKVHDSHAGQILHR